MKYQSHIKMFICMIMVTFISFTGCNKSTETAKNNPVTDSGKNDVDNNTAAKPLINDTTNSSDETTSEPVKDAETQKENEVLNVVGTVYKVNNMLIIITDIKSEKPVDDMDETPLNLTLRISNKDPENELLYTSWTPLDSELSSNKRVSHIQDDQGTIYPILLAKKDQPYAGQVLQKKLKPGEAIKDVLLFKELKPDTKRIKLYLVGSEMTDHKDLVFNLQVP
ncbi:hypothetical protein [Gimesia alba]|nr:hypothetical protein [Gimesia alba]